MHSSSPSLKKLAPALGFVALSALVPSRPASAQAFTVTFSGTVSYLAGTGNPFDSTVTPGAPFTCTFTWDRAIPVSSSTATSTRWISTGYAHGLTLSVGDVTLTPGPDGTTFPQTLVIHQNRTATNGDSTFVQTAGEVITGPATGKPIITIDAECFSRLADPAVPESLTDPGADWLDPFPVADASIISYGTTLSTVNFNVTSVSGTGLTPAPEPSQSAALTLGVLGLTSLALKAHRRG